MYITVFTATYNRKGLLPKLYKSLCEQTCLQFEWLVVDDGSIDGTENLFVAWEKQSTFHIHYVKQENGGKHRAINRGVSIAKGEMFLIVDSDDWLPKDAIEKIIVSEKEIKEKNIAGVCGNTHYSDGRMIGGSFDSGKWNVIDLYIYECKKFGIYGDKTGAMYTDILKKYPFPEYENEKFIPEAIVFNKICEDGYKIRFIDECLRITEYLPDGLSAKIDTLLIQSFRGYEEYVQGVLSSTHVSMLEKKKCVINYTRRARKNSISYFQIKKFLCNYVRVSLIELPFYNIVANIVYLIRGYKKAKENRAH